MPDPISQANEQTPDNAQASEFQFDETAPTAVVATPADPSAAVESSAMTSAEVDEFIQSLPLPPGFSSFKLPSGTNVVMGPGKGRDLLAAQRVSGNDPNKVMYGLVANLCTFDDRKRVLEEILEMPLADVMTLMGKVNEMTGGDFLPSTTAPSSI